MSRPWEQAAPRPWEVQQAIYPRTVAITRPNTNSSVGAQPYSGVQQSNETSIATGLSASIQMKRGGPRPTAGLPADVHDVGLWIVFIPNASAQAGGVASSGAILDRDVVTDDNGLRYQVTHAYWNSLGWQLTCEKLEA